MDQRTPKKDGTKTEMNSTEKTEAMNKAPIIEPTPIFDDKSVKEIEVHKGGFVDSAGVWHKRPKGMKTAMRNTSGVWFWVPVTADR